MISRRSNRSSGIPCGLYFKNSLPLVVGPSYIRYSSVCCQNHNWCCLAFQRSIQERKTFHVQHVHLVDKQHTRHDLRLTLLSPLWYFLVYLLSNLLSYFSCCPRKQSQKPLWSRIYHINLVQCYCVNDLFSLLNLTLWTIYESCLRPHCIVFWSPCKTSSRFRYLSRGLINCYHITCNYFLLLNCLNHFLTQIVYRLHFSCFKRDFSCFWSRSFY